jgi:ferredoxin
MLTKSYLTGQSQPSRVWHSNSPRSACHKSWRRAASSSKENQTRKVSNRCQNCYAVDSINIQFDVTCKMREKFAVRLPGFASILSVRKSNEKSVKSLPELLRCWLYKYTVRRYMQNEGEVRRQAARLCIHFVCPLSAASRKKKTSCCKLEHLHTYTPTHLKESRQVALRWTPDCRCVGCRRCYKSCEGHHRGRSATRLLKFFVEELLLQRAPSATKKTLRQAPLSKAYREKLVPKT